MTALAVTGSRGFIGGHVVAAADAHGFRAVLPVRWDEPDAAMDAALQGADAVIHLAGVNRPPHPEGFQRGNVGFTERLCARLAALGRPIPVVGASSIRASGEDAYGVSKRQAEEVLRGHARATGARVTICRLPNVFGAGARAEYNSVVATFCHRLQRGRPITVNEPERLLTLVHVDDVVRAFLGAVTPGAPATDRLDVEPTWQLTVGRLAELLSAFRGAAQGASGPPEPDVSPVLRGLLLRTFRSYAAEPGEPAPPPAAG